MDKLKSIKIKNSDGTYTEEIPVGVSIENVDYDSKKSLKEVIGNFDYTEGTMSELIHRPGIPKENVNPSGEHSHAEGAGTVASGQNSHAEGVNTIASGDYSHAEGTGTRATGYISHAEGGNTIASDDYSHAEGLGTIANSVAQHVQGRYNIQDDSDLYSFIIGNGTSRNDRSNAFAMKWDGTCVFGNGTEITPSKFLELSALPMENISYDNLKAKRDAGQLIPGNLYRITDYICTTAQTDTRVEDHPFDIIVVADSPNILNENARACKKDGDEYYVNCSLAAWELKYCLDNDTSRFAWASELGHGVVYYLKDDHNNECPYDFKQIQFTRYKITECTVTSLVGKYTALQHGNAITGIDKQNPVWCYTFSYDPESTGVMSDASVMEFNKNNKANVSENTIKTFFGYQDSGEETVLKVVCLNDIVMFGNACSNNQFENNCFLDTLGNNCYNNTFKNNCRSNTFGDNNNSNMFGTGCFFNTFGNNCTGNYLDGACFSVTFGDVCQYNKLGDGCYSNTFGNNCYNNIIGSKSSGNTFGSYCDSNTFGRDCSFIDISGGALLSKKEYYYVLDGVAGKSSSHISITDTNGNKFVTYVGMNSSGELKTWVPADLVPAEEPPTPTTEG